MREAINYNSVVQHMIRRNNRLSGGILNHEQNRTVSYAAVRSMNTVAVLRRFCNPTWMFVVIATTWLVQHLPGLKLACSRRMIVGDSVHINLSRSLKHILLSFGFNDFNIAISFALLRSWGLLTDFRMLLWNFAGPIHAYEPVFNKNSEWMSSNRGTLPALTRFRASVTLRVYP